MAVFRVSVKVAEISYPSTFSVVEFLGIALPPQRNEKQQPTKFPVSRGETQEGDTDEGAALLPCSTLGQVVPRSVGAVLKVLLGLLQPAEVKDLMELCHHTPDVRGRKPAVFHSVDDISIYLLFLGVKKGLNFSVKLPWEVPPFSAKIQKYRP